MHVTFQAGHFSHMKTLIKPCHDDKTQQKDLLYRPLKETQLLYNETISSYIHVKAY